MAGPGVRIERVEVIPYALPFREPYVTARGTLERREIVLLRLVASDGSTGLGEAVPLTLRGGTDLPTVARQIGDASERLHGVELTATPAEPLAAAIATVLELAAPRRLAPPALAALESALFDLATRVAGVPLWRALGAQRPEPIACNATLVAAEPGAVVRQALDWAGAGFATFKLKLGAGFDDVASVRGVRSALGPTARLRVDVNEAWRVREALAALAALEPFDIELCEQPVAGLRALARVARGTRIPLAADEAVASEADAHRARQRRACTFAAAKLSKVGGIGACGAIARVLPTYLSSALDGPVGIAAAAHCATAMPDAGIAHGLATQRLFAATIARRECTLTGGALRLPEGPGLGVELDEELLARHALERG